MKNFIRLCLLTYSVFVYAQIITFKDSTSGQAISQVTLVSDAPKAFATTNSKGQVDLGSFQHAEKIEISGSGYKTETKSYSELSTSPTFYMQSVVVTLDEVVISATRWNQQSKKVPNKIITISEKDVAFQNPQTAADLLGISGEVFIQKSQQGGGSPMIRGFATNRLLYTVDGVRMNTAIFRGGNIQNVISLDPLAIEKTEVLFGPGSVIYGSDAIGGVMSFQTLKPQLSLDGKTLISGKSVARYSSANNEKTAHADISVGWKKFAMVSSFTSSDFGDLKMGSNGPDEYLRPFYVQRQDSADVVITNDDPKVQRPSGYSQINLMQKFRFAPNDKWDFQYGIHYSTTSSYSRYDRHIRYKNGLPRYGEFYYGPQVWTMNNVSVTHSGFNAVYDQMSIRLAHQYFEESRISRDINKADREMRTEKVDAYSVNLDFNKSLATRHIFYYGLEFVKNDVVSRGVNEDISTGIKESGPARYPQAEWASYAAYLNYQFELSKQFRIQAGLRYNQYTLDAVFDTTFYPFPYTTANIQNAAVTGSLGFVFTPTEKWAISANASTGFRSPNVDDAGKVFDSEPGSVVVPNPSLGSEYAYNVEADIAKVFGDVVKIDAAAYYTILENALVRRDYTLNGLDSIEYDGEMSNVQAIQNAAVARVYGIQTGLDVKLPAGFLFSTDFNYQLGEEELDDKTISPARHAAPWFGVTRLTYSKDKLILQLYANYSGMKTYDQLPEEEKAKTELYAVDNDGNPFSPGWYTVNFKTMYQFADNFSFSAGIENITDQRYRPYSSGLAAPGRNFILSLKAFF